MIDIIMDIDGMPSVTKVNLGNQYENKDKNIHFDLPSSFDAYNKYVIAVHKVKDKITTKVLPIVDNIFTVTSDLTMLSGNWQLCLMCRENALDLTQDHINLAPQENEHVFISDVIVGTVNPSYFQTLLRTTQN